MKRLVCREEGAWNHAIREETAGATVCAWSWQTKAVTGCSRVAEAAGDEGLHARWRGRPTWSAKGDGTWSGAGVASGASGSQGLQAYSSRVYWSREGGQALDSHCWE